jgi:hypothetical protein
MACPAEVHPGRSENHRDPVPERTGTKETNWLEMDLLPPIERVCFLPPEIAEALRTGIARGEYPLAPSLGMPQRVRHRRLADDDPRRLVAELIANVVRTADPRGRGLFKVAALSARWDWYLTKEPNGQVVWCEIGNHS